MSDASSRPPEGKPFLLGLTLAGSVSAGAYLAGVTDFLIRALDAHATANPERPVVLKVISGTSGGGTSASLAVASLLDGSPSELHAGTYRLDPEAGPGAASPRDYSFALRRLHDIWVTELSLTVDPLDRAREAAAARPATPPLPEDETTREGLLDVADLSAARAARLPAPSLLNGVAIDRAANRALADVRWNRGAPYPFVAEPLDLFITTTNVQGVVYKVRFDRNSAHLMSRHAMARHFAVHGLGGRPIGSPWLEAYHDRGLRLQAPERGGAVDLRARSRTRAATAWTHLRETAMASGAFPVGLPPRFIHATMGEHQPFEVDGAPLAAGGAWPLDLPRADLPGPDWGRAEARRDGDATYLAVDGGVSNNEPFEFARFTLRPEAPGGERASGADWLAPNPRGAAEADRAVIMIDAFPEGGVFGAVSPDNPEDLAAAGLPGSLGKLFGAMISQARFKPAELAAAAETEIKSRFMIAPSRPARDGAEPLSSSSLLACGALGGFSGFLDLRFRQHDFILGQRNAQRFLQQHFALDPANPVFGDTQGPRTERGERPIVELSPELARPIEQPDWPRMTVAELLALRGPIRGRLQALYETQVAAMRPGPITRAVAWAVWTGGGKGRIAAIGLRALESALIEHGLLAMELPESLYAPEARRVIARLVVSAGEPLSVEAIAESFAQTRRRKGEPARTAAQLAAERESIAATLSELKRLRRSGHRYRVTTTTREGAEAWVLERHAGLLRGLPGRVFS
ncbi:hypothetical protein [uncultured Albimonas sp.]|uniref:hypothetical protein n=1 Tax=uncultured Albimonas sp. TaxID=1331701 RepID=UPI0030EC315C